MAIPKVIHYVWCGTADLPEQDKKYIEGWQKLNPDFKIKRWSEKDIDLKKYPLVKKGFCLRLCRADKAANAAFLWLGLAASAALIAWKIKMIP